MARMGNQSITRRLTWINMLVSGAALLVASGAFTAYETVLFRESLVRHLSESAQMIGANSVSAVIFNDQKSAEASLEALRAAAHVTSAWIYTPDGKPFAGYRRDPGAAIPLMPALSPNAAEKPLVHG